MGLQNIVEQPRILYFDSLVEEYWFRSRIQITLYYNLRSL